MYLPAGVFGRHTATRLPRWRACVLEPLLRRLQQLEVQLRAHHQSADQAGRDRGLAAAAQQQNEDSAVLSLGAQVLEQVTELKAAGHAHLPLAADGPAFSPFVAGILVL